MRYHWCCLLLVAASLLLVAASLLLLLLRLNKYMSQKRHDLDRVLSLLITWKL